MKKELTSKDGYQLELQKTQRYRLEKEKEDDEIRKAREEICKERGTPWDHGRKNFDLAICAWHSEDKCETEEEREDEKRWNRKLKPATRFQGAKSSKEIEETMRTEHEAEIRIKEDEKRKRELERWHKFDAMFKAEADRRRRS
ncbi:d5fa10e8-fe5c-4e6b-8b3f-da58fb9aadf2 [Sclerotinia trifoliorum]|uniref:D5fa10e8-fe5c-4e6b-8b3f-da58fb9aadf2 n=1 Tax=Sclerotinia trifoliorum TaxID=28548 RepID=A0A8H2ZU83_9HELO|nr:d5fa10e8-fe5c-4e6b-8b3f-da58fb9aadf2 [Sclerotinia trifoliorum]